MGSKLGRWLTLALAGGALLAAPRHARSGELVNPPPTTTPTLKATEPSPFAPSTTQFDFAKGLLVRNLYPEAAEEFSRFITDFPQDSRIAAAILWRGEAYFAGDDYQKASLDFYAYLTQHKDQPKQTFATLRYGCCLFELGRHKQAAAMLQPLTTPKIEDPGVRMSAAYYLGLSQAFLGQPAAALAALEQVTEGPLRADATFERAELLSALGKHSESAALFIHFRETWPEHGRSGGALLRQGEELRIAGRLDDAAVSFLSLIKGSRRDPRALQRARYGLGWVRYAQEDFKAARELAEELLALFTKDPQAALQLDPELRFDATYLQGLSAFRLQDFAMAAEAFAKVTGGTYLSEARVKLAWAELAAGRSDAALGAVQTALAAEKNFHPELHYIAGKAQQRKQEWRAALDEFTSTRDAKAAYQTQATFEVANTWAALGKTEEAAHAYGYFVKTYPENPLVPDALVQQAQHLIAAEKFVAAVPVLEALLSRQLLPDSIREHAFSQQAVCYFRMKQYTNMQRTYQLLLEQYPKSSAAPEALYWLAWVEHQEKHFAQAAKLYAELIATFPESELAPRARYRRAMSLYHEGQKEEAAAALFEIVTKYPNILLDQKELLWLGQHYMDSGRFMDAETVYTALLAPERKAGRDARALAFYFQAESRRRRGDWEGALKRYERLLSEQETGLESAAAFGQAQCLRKLGKLPEAGEALGKVQLAADDPLVAHLLSERGLLAFEQKEYLEAVRNLMRVGLVYDNEALAGEALYVAGEACLALQDTRKARICFEELAGGPEESYGKRYPENAWAKKGREALGRLNPAPDTAPAPPPTAKDMR